MTTYTLDPSASSGQAVAAGLPQVLVEHSGASRTSYLYGLDLIGEQGAAWAYHLHDGLGSVRQLVDGAGQVTLAQGARPFGAPLWQAGSGSSGFGYTGEQVDASTGLVFLRARYYDSGTGRFLSVDPWRGNVQRPGTLNRYVYVLDNPLKYTDPTGHTCANPRSEQEAIDCALTEKELLNSTGDNIFPDVPNWIVYDVLAQDFPHLVDVPFSEWQAHRFGELWAFSIHEAYAQGYLSKQDSDYLTLYGAVPLMMSDPNVQMMAAAQGFQMATYAWGCSAVTSELFEQTTGYSNYWSFEDETYQFNLGGRGIGGGAGPWHDLGYLPSDIARQIQDIVDDVGHPLYVVGGATYKSGFNDIDYAAYGGGAWEAYMAHGPLPGAEHPPFPLDTSWGVQPGHGYILFQPGQLPVFMPPSIR